LGEGSLRDWDEAIYAQVSREIIQNNDWITLRHGYEIYFEKPPLFMWIIALFYKFFGVSEFSVRITSVISGTLLVWLTYLIGRTIHGSRTGFLAGLILLGCYGFVFEARNGEQDMLLSLLVFSGMFAYLQLKNGSQKWWCLVWISFAFAFMVKFWAALILPAVLMPIILLERRNKETLQNKYFWLGILLAIIIVAPWHILIYLQYGKDFFDIYITRNLLERTLTSMESHSGTPLFYLDVLRRLFSPWYFLFPFALALAIREFFKKKQMTDIIFIEILLVLVIYTFVVDTKNPSYIFPVFPALSIMTANLLTRASSSTKSFAYIWLITAALIATTVIPDKLLILFILIMIGLIALLKMNVFHENGFRSMVVYVVFITFFLSNVISYFTGNHRIRIWPVYGLDDSPAAQIASIAGENRTASPTPIICFALVEDWASYYAVEGPTAVFYSNRPIIKVTTWDQLIEVMKGKPSSEILIAQKYISKLSEEFEITIIDDVEPLVYAKISH